MMELVSAADAAKQFGLNDRLSSFTSWQWDSYLKDAAVLVHRGNLHIAGDLCLDNYAGPWIEGAAVSQPSWPTEFLALVGAPGAPLDAGPSKGLVAGLVVDGDLHLEGALINTSMESGAFLLVRGALRARNVSGGGAEIVIQGPALVDDAVIGHYNDGILNFECGLRTPLCINEDHALSITGERHIGFFWSSHEDSRNEVTALYRHVADVDDANDVLPIDLARRVRADLDRWERLTHAMVRGESVLFRPGGAAARIESEERERAGAQWDRLRFVPEDERSAALCDAALENSGLALIFTPPDLWTDARVAHAARSAPELLHEVIPAARLTGDMILGAARARGFDWLKADWQTGDLLIELIRGDPSVEILRDVEPKHVTMAVVAAAREIYAGNKRYAALEAERSDVKGCETFYLLTRIWSGFLSEGDIVRSMKECGNAGAIHRSAMTPAVCDAMVEYRGDNMAFIPEEFIRDQHVDQALGRSGLYLEHVPERMRTRERCEAAVRDDGRALQYVPQSLLTEEICVAAVETTGRALEHVPEAFRTEALCRRAVKHTDPARIEDVPAQWREPLAAEAEAFAAREREKPRASIIETSPMPTARSVRGMVLRAIWEQMWKPHEKMIAAGATGALASRPVLLMFLHAASTVAFLGMHLWLCWVAYGQAGWFGAALNLVLPLMAEVYWAYVMAGQGKVMGSILVVLVTCAQVGLGVVRRRAALRLLQSGETDTPDEPRR
jgi:hypothetical protein